MNRLFALIALPVCSLLCLGVITVQAQSSITLAQGPLAQTPTGVAESDFFPLYFGRSHWDTNTATRATATRAISKLEEDFVYPFGRYEDDGIEWWGGLRPFLSWGGNRSQEQFFRFLPPLYKSNWSPDETDHRLLFWSNRKTLLPENRLRNDIRYLPFYYRTGIEGEQVSEAWSFIYGHLYKKFGVDESEYWGFPLYLRTRKGEFINHTLLWPFLGYGSGGGGSNVRFWPFYGQKVIPGQSSSVFVMWPFWGHQLKVDEEGETTESFGSFPLYSKVHSKTLDGWGFLWPFFKHNKINRPRRTLDDLSCPFPFYSRTLDVRRDSEGQVTGGEDTLLVFPFYGYIQKANEKRLLDVEYKSIFYWKIHRQKKGELDSRRTVLFPFVWIDKNRWETTGVEGTSLKVWPFFNSTIDKDGNSFFRLFDPFWWRRGTDMDRHYAPFFALYERERDLQGYGYDQVFGKAFYQVSYPGYYRANYLHTLTLFDTPEKGRGWSIFRGLLGRSVREGKTNWKLFWWALD